MQIQRKGIYFDILTSTDDHDLRLEPRNTEVDHKATPSLNMENTTNQRIQRMAI